jgi:hypothetical protein
MKKLLILLSLVILMQAGLYSQTTWKSPDFKPGTLRKVMILAKVTDETARKQLEDFTVKYLRDKGIDAVPAYANLGETRFGTRESFLAFTDSIHVDALLVYSVESAEKVVQNTPTVSVGVGVGMYGGYAGASTPIAGGPKVVALVTVSGKYYTRTTTGAQWIISLKGTLEGSTDKLAHSFAKSTAKAMLKEGLFVQKK